MQGVKYLARAEPSPLQDGWVTVSKLHAALPCKQPGPVLLYHLFEVAAARGRQRHTSYININIYL